MGSRLTPGLPYPDMQEDPAYAESTLPPTEVVTPPVNRRQELLDMLMARAKAPVDTAALAAEQESERQRQMALGIIEGTTHMAKGYAGAASPTDMTSAKEASRAQLNNYLAQKKAERDQEYDKFQAVKEMADLEQTKERQAVSDKQAQLAQARFDRPQFIPDRATGKIAKFVRGQYVGDAIPSELKANYFENLNPNQKKIYGEIEKQVSSNPEVKMALSSLSTIQQIEPKITAAEAGDTGQLASAINNAARAIGGEKGVMTDRDVLRASGLPADWYGKTSDQILTQIGQLDQTQQIQTLKAMVNASKLTYNKQLQSVNLGAKSKAKAKGLEVPEGTDFLPVSASMLEIQPTVSLAPTPQGAVDKVRVKNPEGKIGLIPASQLESALKKGFTRVE